MSLHLHTIQQQNGCGEWTQWHRESSEIQSGFQVQTNIWKLSLPLHPPQIMTYFPSLARRAIPIILPGGLILLLERRAQKTALALQLRVLDKVFHLRTACLSPWQSVAIPICVSSLRSGRKARRAASGWDCSWFKLIPQITFFWSLKPKVLFKHDMLCLQ